MHVPFSVFHKAANGKMRVGGICSTERREADLDDELVKQDGLDFSNLLKTGWLNDNHGKDTTAIVGIPDTIRRTTYKGHPATYVEGELLSGYEPAEKLFQLAKALQKTKRPLGFSLQGKVLRREGPDRKIVAEARVDHIAITAIPVNTDTTLQTLSKSLECETSRRTSQAVLQACGAAMDSIREDLVKALSAGSAISNPGVAAGEGFPLRPESLEGTPKVTAGPPRPRRKKKRNRKILTKAQALEVIRGRFGVLPRTTAERIFQLAAAQGA
jgi:hypothetical protein